METTFRKELEHLINSKSLGNGSNTPDFILADYLVDCLITFDKTINARKKWYGRQISESKLTKIKESK